ncbi:unnamed protein product, partial [Mesorhabditis belari]|uniref:Protein kinase domain-containing protein n=1 Tax=Mesorhabditis belari TaxID=2138241 RepID=A0AAF3F6S5_9BILA
MIEMTSTISTTLDTTPTDSVVSQGVVHLGAPGLSQSAPASPRLSPIIPKKEPIDYVKGSAGMFNNILTSCFGSFFPIFGAKKGDSIASYSGDDWEIPFESITNLEWLGAGSQGAVFSGRLNAETVAVKKVKELKDTETKHLRYLDHRNIIKFMGICTQAPCFCIVMEFCSNGQLNELLKSTELTPSKRWVDMAQQVASGMEYLHRNKIVHRDLKSPNILAAGDGTMKISDFGTSQKWNKMNSALMSFCGTVSWMAPEMIKKDPCSEKVDVWSFGVVLWEMITCEQPYQGIDSMAVLWGVGSNKLSLPLPERIPDGLRMLVQQCWSQKARNRPSFQGILQHLYILANELAYWGEEEWLTRYSMWREEAKAIKYPETLQGHPGNLREHEEQEQVRKRKEELKHAQDIRVMYETKFRRCNKMYQKLTTLLEELEVRENEGSFSGRGAVVVRAGPKTHKGEATANVFTTAVPHPSYYGAGMYGEEMSSSDDEVPSPDLNRGSPYRCSQASSWSGHPSFSRQSSVRSSQGPRPVRPSPNRPQNFSNSPNLIREAAIRQSASSHCGDFSRNSPARHSGLSEDSGIQMWPSRVNSCGLLSETGAGQPACFSQMIYRHGEGRWSDGSARRRMKKSRDNFRRDSPARVPQVRANRDKDKRASCPAAAERDPSVASQRSDTVYDNCDRSASVAPSSSYEEALAAFGSSPTMPTVHHSTSTLAPPTQTATLTINNQIAYTAVNGYTNPLYSSPVSTYENPLAENPNLLRVDQNIDLASSMDSNNPMPTQRRNSDASDESSSSEEEQQDNRNGNLFESSLDSDRAGKTFQRERTTSDEERSAIERRRHALMLLESSASMASSLERSLEMGAIHSDGLSDKETALRRVQRTIKTHRRTHSGGQPIQMTVVDETSTESEENEEAVQC